MINEELRKKAETVLNGTYDDEDEVLNIETMIEDLISMIEIKDLKIKEIKQDIEDNYRQIKYSEQI